jgi:hypothetical protein
MKYKVIVYLKDDVILEFEVEATSKIKACSKVINDNKLSEIIEIKTEPC